MPEEPEEEVLPSRTPFHVARVTVVMDGTVVLMAPCDDASRMVLQEVLDAPVDCRDWKFVGSIYQSPAIKDRLIGVRYACGARPVRERRSPNMLNHTHYGLIELELDLSDAEDQAAIYAMRDFGYLASGITVMEESTSDAMRLMCTSTCKVCGGALVRSVEVEWKTCDACSTVCEHQYTEGVGQANGHLAYLPFCKKCGRGDPSWQASENPLEDITNTVREGGLDALFIQHPDGSTTLLTRP